MALEEIPPASLKTFGNTAALFSPQDLSEVETGGGGNNGHAPPSSQEIVRLSQGQWDIGSLGLESDFGFFSGRVDFDGLDLGVLD
jgi:hypothetical protein